MSKNTVHRKRILIASLLLFVSVLCIDFLTLIGTFFHFGKDNGLVFRIIGLTIFSLVFFLAIKKSVGNAIVGLIVGFLSYFITATIIYWSSQLIKGNHKGMNIPLIYYQLISVIIILSIGAIVYKIQEKP